MRPAALPIAVLLAIATLGGAAPAQATPPLRATIVVESARTVEIGGKRHHRDFRRKAAPHRHKTLSRHHTRWHDGRHHKRWQHGRHHRHAVAKGFRKAPVVIIKPAYGRKFGHRHLPARPPLKHGRFTRRAFHW